MSNGNSTFLIVAGVGVALLALLLLLGSGSEPAPVVDAIPTTSTTMLSSSSMEATYYSTLVVHAGLDRTVGEREQIELSGEGHDPQGGPVSYQWTADGGLGFFEDPHSPTTMFTAPSACDCDDMVTLTLSVTGASGFSVSDKMVVSVRDPLACPVEMCETSGFYEAIPGEAICLDNGEEATCPAAPSEPCDSPCISEAPINEGCPQPPVPCPCTDDVDCSEPWQTGWPFDDQAVLHPKDRAKPSIDRHFPREISEGSTIYLEGYIRNPACQTVCYTWAASKGWLENTNTLTPTYHAPDSDRLEGETVTISLIVYDTVQGRSYDQIRIKIRNTNPG